MEKAAGFHEGLMGASQDIFPWRTVWSVERVSIEDNSETRFVLGGGGGRSLGLWVCDRVGGKYPCDGDAFVRVMVNAALMLEFASRRFGLRCYT